MSKVLWYLRGEVRGVDEQTHEATGEGSGNGDGQDPTGQEETDSLPVDSAPGSIAQTNTDGGTGDAHGGRDGETELRGEEDGDGGSHLHRATTGRRVAIGKLTLHDVVTVGDEADGESKTKNSELPDGDGGLIGSLLLRPGVRECVSHTDGVTDIVSTVSERGSAGSENLNEGVAVFDLVGVLLGVAVDTGHTGTLRGSENTRLSTVDVVVDTVESSNNDHGGDADEDSLDVVDFVQRTSAHRVFTESAESPAERSTPLDDPVVHLALLGGDHLLVFLLVKGTQEDVVPADGLVLLDDKGVDVGNEEDSRQNSNAGTGADDNGGDPPSGLLVQVELRRALVDDGKGADGGGEEEPEGRGVHSPRSRVLAHVDNDLDEHEDGGSEASRDDRGHAETSEDGAETLTVVPSPLNLGGTNGSNTNTSDGGDDGVAGGDVGGVGSAPHNPGRGGGDGAGESQHLDTGVGLEGSRGDDTVLDGRGGTGTGSNGTSQLTASGQDHGPSV
ncbi:unnamed protein product [Clonostachys rosea]|uniref:Uncharacterized protein n=1 Tax=Bionectria ochroleuca TaxID=29856 RepID=A0ABY6UJC7_BIOOC|nr:unnamed protein product [Clonostachys rosea]